MPSCSICMIKNSDFEYFFPRYFSSYCFWELPLHRTAPPPTFFGRGSNFSNSLICMRSLFWVSLSSPFFSHHAFSLLCLFKKSFMIKKVNPLFSQSYINHFIWALDFGIMQIFSNPSSDNYSFTFSFSCSVIYRV